MSEREVTIVIRGKNLTKAEFDAARKELAGVDDQAKKTSASSMTLGNAFKAVGAAAAALGVVSAIKDFADFTGQLTDMSAKTGIGVEALQRLRYAAEQNGGTLEQVTGAITKLGANLAGGNDSAAGALKVLGLSFDDIRKMSPDEAFTAIADAIAKVPDPMAQSKLAMDLFGKSGAELLPMMKGNLSETAAAADRLGIVMSESAVAAGDQFGDTMGTLALVGKSLTAQVLEPMIPVLTTVAQWLGEKLPGAVSFIVDSLSIGFARAWLDARLMFNQFLLGIAEGVNSIPLLGKAIGFSASTIKGLRDDVGDAKLAIEIFDAQSVTASKTQEKAAKTMSTLNLEYANHKKVVTEEVDPAVQRLTKSFQEQIEKHQKLRSEVTRPDVPEAFRLTRAELVLGAPIQARSTLEWARLREEQEKIAAQMGATLAPSVKRVSASLDDATGSTVTFGAAMKASLGDVMQSIPGTLARAFEGGGNMLGAVKSIGSQLGSKLGSSLGEFIGGPGFGQILGPALGAIGSLAGKAIGAIAGLFTDKNAAEVRKYNAEIGKVRDTLLEQHGTMEQIEARARAVGLSFQNEWGHQGKAGLEAFNTLAKEFNKRWDELNTKLTDARGELDAMVQRGRDLGYEFDQAGNLVSVNYEKMREAAERYGITQDGLGEGFQRQRLHQSAAEIINDFELLTKGGANVGGVLKGMANEIGTLVRDSIKFGTEIPANMKPWVEELFRTQQLVDDNGVAINDLSSLKFGEPMATEFQKISTKIQELIEAIKEMVDRINTTLTPAIDAATRNRTIRVGWEVEEPPDFGGSGNREPGFARGTYGMTGVDFPDFGDGTRVIVHNRESIVPYEDRLSTAKRWLQQSGAGMAAAASIAVAAPNVYVVNDFSGARQVTESEFRQVQARLNSGELQVPARAITQRGR